MRIMVVGPAYQNQPQSVTEALRSYGHDVIYYPLVEFYVGCTYWERKIYKFGRREVEKKYNARQAFALKSACDDFYPDLIFVLNGLMISPMALEAIDNYKKILWLWDGLSRCTKLNEILPYFQTVFTFEYDDVEKLRAKGFEASYLPLGYDENIFYPQYRERDIDISFIGIPNNERLKILNKVAEYAVTKDLNMFIGGPWYSTRHFWKKMSFRYKYPYLCQYLHNRIIKPIEAADIYRRSKICLNLNVSDHKSLNPRTFEIIATKSLMLMNDNVDLHGLLCDNSFVSFTGENDIIGKINKLLDDKEHREKIAECGYKYILGKMSYNGLLKNVYKKDL